MEPHSHLSTSEPYLFIGKPKRSSLPGDKWKSLSSIDRSQFLKLDKPFVNFSQRQCRFHLFVRGKLLFRCVNLKEAAVPRNTTARKDRQIKMDRIAIDVDNKSVVRKYYISKNVFNSATTISHHRTDYIWITLHGLIHGPSLFHCAKPSKTRESGSENYCWLLCFWSFLFIWKCFSYFYGSKRPGFICFRIDSHLWYSRVSVHFWFPFVPRKLLVPLISHDASAILDAMMQYMTARFNCISLSNKLVF